MDRSRALNVQDILSVSGEGVPLSCVAEPSNIASRYSFSLIRTGLAIFVKQETQIIHLFDAFCTLDTNLELHFSRLLGRVPRQLDGRVIVV